MATLNFLRSTITCLLLLVLIGGCASTAKDISAAATPVVVSSGLHQANQPDEQQQIQKLFESPAFQKFGQSVGEGVGIGLFNQANKLASGDDSSNAAATQPTTGPTTGPMTGPASRAPGKAAVAGLASGGGLNGFVKSSVQEAFLAATDPQFKKGEEAMSEAIGEGFVTGMITVLNKEGPALGDTIRKQLGPIVQELIREQIAPALRDMLKDNIAPAALQVWKEGAVETLKLTVRPDLQPDVVRNAQNASLGATRGTHQAMVESGVLAPDGQLSTHLKIYLWTGGVAVGLILLASFSLLVLLNLIALHHWRRRDMAHKVALSKPKSGSEPEA
jgi:hypothetical protein